MSRDVTVLCRVFVFVLAFLNNNITTSTVSEQTHTPIETYIDTCETAGVNPSLSLQMQQALGHYAERNHTTCTLRGSQPRLARDNTTQRNIDEDTIQNK